MKKNMVLGTILVLCLIGVGIIINYSKSSNKLKNTPDEVFYETRSYLTDEIKSKAEQTIPSASFASDNSPSAILNNSDAVAIVSVISVDGVNNKISPAVGSSYGELVINNVLVGDLNVGEKVEYIKSGAIMTLAEWEEAQPEDARRKREEIRKESGVDDSYLTDTYRQFHYANDLIVEEGKTYLAYLKFNKSVGKYEIIGRENGLRELNIDKQEKVSSKSYELENYTIKNNVTKEYESLNEYVSMNVTTIKK